MDSKNSHNSITTSIFFDSLKEYQNDILVAVEMYKKSTKLSVNAFMNINLITDNIDKIVDGIEQDIKNEIALDALYLDADRQLFLALMSVLLQYRSENVTTSEFNLYTKIYKITLNFYMYVLENY